MPLQFLEPETRTHIDDIVSKHDNEFSTLRWKLYNEGLVLNREAVSCCLSLPLSLSLSSLSLALSPSLSPSLSLSLPPSLSLSLFLPISLSLSSHLSQVSVSTRWLASWPPSMTFGKSFSLLL